MKFVIDRNRWLRGEGGDVSRLLRPSDGKMCCLGFCSLALGLSPEQIADVTKPQLIKDDRIPAWLRFFASQRHDRDAHRLMEINDRYEEAGREQEITKIFNKYGVEVEFVN